MTAGSPNAPGEHTGWSLIPEALRNRDQWIMTASKSPVKPRKGWNEPTKQFGFDRARNLARHPKYEPAYVLRAEDPYVVIDMDDVGPDEPTRVSEEAAEIVRQLDTYTEASRSGTGLHLVCEGTRLPDRRESGTLDETGRIEVFDANHYVILTGNRIDSYDTIRDGHQVGPDNKDVLAELQRSYLRRRSEPVDTDQESSLDLGEGARDSTEVQVEDIHQTIQEYAKDGREEAQRALERWNSPAGSDCGLKSASEADMALVADLAFWCREDTALMDRCFRASNRMREKWDEVHYSDGRTYGEGTIQTAIRTNYDTFSGNYVQHR